MFDHLPERPLEVRKRRSERGPAGIKYDIPPRIELGPVQAERFPQTTLDAVSIHASADRTGNGESQSRTATFAVFPRETKGGEQGAGNALAMVIHFSEVGGAQGPWC